MYTAKGFLCTEHHENEGGLSACELIRYNNPMLLTISFGKSLIVIQLLLIARIVQWPYCSDYTFVMKTYQTCLENVKIINLN